jgi:hypothetical protein
MPNIDEQHPTRPLVDQFSQWYVALLDQVEAMPTDLLRLCRIRLVAATRRIDDELARRRSPVDATERMWR